MVKIKDLTPKLSIPTLEDELQFPADFQEGTNQYIGGLTAGSRELTHGKIKIQGVDERMLFGDVEDYSTGIGVYIGKDPSDGLYKFRAGDPAGVMLSWNGSAVNVVGFLSEGDAANDINTNVTTIDGGKITAATITATQLVTTSALITAAAQIQDAVITSAKIVSLDATKITSQIVNAQIATIEWAKITSVSIDNADITDLSASKINTGTLSGISISIGSGNSIFKADGNGIYLGNATFGSAPFRVNMSGSVTASSITLTNASVGSGSSYTGNQIAEAYIGNLNASKITAGTISADRIGAGTIVSSKLATDITVSGTLVSNKLNIGGSSAQPFYIWGAYITTGGTIHTNDSKLYMNGSTDKLEMHDDLTIEGDTYIGTGSMSFENGNVLTMSSSKSAIVPTHDGYRALYCAESPEVWFFDFVESKDRMDTLFEEVTVGEKHFIKTEGGQYLVFAKRKGHEHKRFEYKTEAEFIKNEEFLRMAKLNKGDY